MSRDVTQTAYQTTDGFYAQFDATKLHSADLKRITDPGAPKLDSTELLAMLDDYPKVVITFASDDMPPPQEQVADEPLPTEDMEADVWTLYYRVQDRGIKVGGEIQNKKMKEATKNREQRKEKLHEEYEMKMSAARETRSANLATAGTTIAGAGMQAAGGMAGLRDVHLSMKSSKETKGHGEKIELIKKEQKELKPKYEEKAKKLEKRGERLDEMHADATKRKQDREARLKELEAQRPSEDEENRRFRPGVDDSYLTWRRNKLDSQIDELRPDQQLASDDADRHALRAQAIEKDLPGDSKRLMDLRDELGTLEDRQNVHLDRMNEADGELLKLAQDANTPVHKLTAAQRSRDYHADQATEVGVRIEGQRAKIESAKESLSAKLTQIADIRSDETAHRNVSNERANQIKGLEQQRDNVGKDLADYKKLKTVDGEIFNLRHEENASVRANELPNIEALQKKNETDIELNRKSYSDDVEATETKITDLRKTTEEKNHEATVLNQRSMVWSQFGQGASQLITGSGQTGAAGDTYQASADSAEAELKHNESELDQLDYDQNKGLAESFRQLQLDTINTMKTVWESKLDAQKASMHYT